MHALRDTLSRRLRELGVEERAWPGRDDGFASLHFRGKEFAHFHHWSEIDIRLGKDVIKRERLVRAAPSKVHPDRASGSPWFEIALNSTADVDEALRLVKLVVASMERKA
ncbi:MAG: DUF5519 family protein [Xanthomonadales bacterium]|nr:DUF5519 family protein [Xanthomonadales bacterium]